MDFELNNEYLHIKTVVEAWEAEGVVTTNDGRTFQMLPPRATVA